MGAHGASGYRDGFVGSNTYNVIKYASCPVLSIPQKKKQINFKKILFPIRPVTGALFPYEVVRFFTSPATLLEVMGLTTKTIIDTKGSTLDTIIHEIKHLLNNDQVTTKTIWSGGSGIADEIMHYTNTHSPDLVVITSALDVTSKPKYIGPHSQKIIHCSKVPVLNIKKVAVPVFV
jgi:nucleotide-binding universal stress UspA family protein